MIERLTERDLYGNATLKGRDYFIDDVCATYANEHAQALWRALDKLAHYEDSGLTPEEVKGLAASEKTEAAPVAHARWNRLVPGESGPYCSNCKEEAPYFAYYGFYKPRYCPYCGARMDVEEVES